MSTVSHQQGNFLRHHIFELYWFSGTGNTLLVAEEIERTLQGNQLTTTMYPLETTNPTTIDLQSVVGLIVPVSGQGTYPVVWDFVETMPATDQGTPCFLVDTLGYYSGGIIGPMGNILRKKGYNLLGAAEIRMPINVFKRSQHPEQEAQQREQGIKQAHDFVNDLLAGHTRWRDIPIYSTMMGFFSRNKKVYHLLHTFLPLRIHADQCSACGLCVQLCPTHHLQMPTPKTPPTQGNTCILCHRCFGLCPRGAITIGNTKNLRYHAVTAAHLRQRLAHRKLSP